MFESIYKKHPALRVTTYLIMLLIAILLATFLLAKSITEFNSSTFGYEQQRTISVTGNGEVIAVPDVAVFTFDVREEAITVVAAQSVATEKINKIKDLLDENDIKEENIKTVSYNVYPKYEWVSSDRCAEIFDCNDKEQKVSGYEVSQSTKVKVEDIDLAGELVAMIGGIGVSYISGLQFVIDEDNDLKEEAQDMAIADAREKAERRAESLDVKLGDLVSFYENTSGRDPYPMYAETMSVKSGAFDQAPTLSPGEEIVKSEVNIIFEIK
jgi:uncharacterized protein YggE